LSVDLLPSAIAAGVVMLAAHRLSGNGTAPGPRAAAWFAIATAASASLPIMVSPKQASYYAAASWPFFTMALAAVCVPAVGALAESWAARPDFSRSTRRVCLSAGGCILVLIVSSPIWCGQYFRDRSLLDDVRQIGRIVGPHGSLEMGPGVREEWSLQAYLYRRHFVSLELNGRPRTYRLELVEREHAATNEYVQHDARLKHYRVYRRVGMAASSQPNSSAAVQRRVAR
jgi:hypothetical protein